jgi:hypothetical protein
MCILGGTVKVNKPSTHTGTKCIGDHNRWQTLYNLIFANKTIVKLLDLSRKKFPISL